MADTKEANAITFLTEQHDTVRDLLEAVARSSGDRRREAFEPLVRLLAVHETAEEMVIYPALKSHSDEAREVSARHLAQEDESKKMLVDLERMDVDSAEFEELFAEVRAAVETHAASEEREVFPLLEEIRDEHQLRRMKAGLTLAQGMAPTHPHKLAPESAIGNLAVGPMVAMVDRVRDAIRAATS